MMKIHPMTRTTKKLGVLVLILVLVLGISIPIAAATGSEVRIARGEVAAANMRIMARMQVARGAMSEVRKALDGHVRAMKKVSPEELAAIQERLAGLRTRMDAIATERTFFVEQMAAFRAKMDAKDLEGAMEVLTAIQTRQTLWLAALDPFIADAKALTADIRTLAEKTGPVWEAQKAKRDAFLAAVKEKKAILDATHEIISAKNQSLKALLTEVRQQIESGALERLTEEERNACRKQLAEIHEGRKTTFDGSVTAQLKVFREKRAAGDDVGALAALDEAIAIQSVRPARIDGWIAQVQTVLDMLKAAVPTL